MWNESQGRFRKNRGEEEIIGASMMIWVIRKARFWLRTARTHADTIGVSPVDIQLAVPLNKTRHWFMSVSWTTSAADLFNHAHKNDHHLSNSTLLLNLLAPKCFPPHFPVSQVPFAMFRGLKVLTFENALQNCFPYNSKFIRPLCTVKTIWANTVHFRNNNFYP